jgi:hypothetical protein
MGGRSGQAVSRGGDTTRSSAEVSAFEDRVAGLKTERAGIFFNGEKILEKKGDSRSVNFTLGDIVAMRQRSGQPDLRGVLITHNHPEHPSFPDVLGGSFSSADLGFVLSQKLGAMRAVDKKYVYEIRTNARLWSLNDTLAKGKADLYEARLQSLYTAEAKRLASLYSNKSEFVKDYMNNGLHRVLQQFVSEFGESIGLTYKRTLR